MGLRGGRAATERVGLRPIERASVAWNRSGQDPLITLVFSETATPMPGSREHSQRQATARSARARAPTDATRSEHATLCPRAGGEQ
eukprot:2101470-Pyramimonas_sp.AAC.1